MHGTRHRTAWLCPECRQIFYSMRGKAAHLWMVHRLALVKRMRYNRSRDAA